MSGLKNNGLTNSRWILILKQTIEFINQNITKHAQLQKKRWEWVDLAISPSEHRDGAPTEGAMRCKWPARHST